MTRTRQLRLTDQDVIRKRIKEFLGKKINIVLKDNRVTTGEVTALPETGVTLTNMRLKKIHFSFSEIAEIYLDTQT
jgi:ribosome maturation factor RimP